MDCAPVGAAKKQCSFLMTCCFTQEHFIVASILDCLVLPFDISCLNAFLSLVPKRRSSRSLSQSGPYRCPARASALQYANGLGLHGACCTFSVTSHKLLYLKEEMAWTALLESMLQCVSQSWVEQLMGDERLESAGMAVAAPS